MTLHALYSSLVTLPVQKTTHISLAESPGKYHFLTERHLQALWWEQIYFQPLRTADGKTVKVLSPGRWNASKGPDFCKAHLLIGGQEVRGDIEIHLQDSSWKAHHHHIDEAYDQTVLHISLGEPASPTPIFTSKGKEILCLYLMGQLTVPIEKISHLVDVDIYPYKPHLNAGLCSKALFIDMPEEELQDFFHSAAAWRLQKKGERIALHQADIEEAFLTGLVQALGYPDNGNAFSDIYKWFSRHAEPNTAQEKIQSQMLGACGFFSAEHQARWDKSPYYRRLLQEWTAAQLLETPTIYLSKRAVRPQHHPVRRLAYLSHLISDQNSGKLLPAVLKVWNEALIDNKNAAVKLWKKIEALIPCYEDRYWNSHYIFEETPQKKFITLLGSTTKKEMIVNTIIPLLYSNYSSNTIEQKLLLDFYSILKGTNNSRIGYLYRRFFGDRAPTYCMNQVFGEQGSLQLYNDFCQHFETSCIGCPFVARYEKTKIINKLCCN